MAPQPRAVEVLPPAPHPHTAAGGGTEALGCTRIWKEQVALFPEASVAVTVTGVVPTGKIAPEEWL
jgi:hypothetical protein